MPTNFEDRVYQITQEIPQGKVVTYGVIAKILNTSPRAVGNALGKNPYKTVPCHRVVGKTGLTGFYKQKDVTALNKKKAILEKEGVVFINDTIDPSCLADNDMLQQFTEIEQASRE